MTQLPATHHPMSPTSEPERGAAAQAPLKSPLSGPVQARSCPVCHHEPGAQVGARIDGGRWVECPECEAVFLSPAPDAAALSAFYSTYYGDYRKLQTPSLDALESMAREGRFDPLTEFALHTAGPSARTFADVGCGQGARLVTLRARGATLVTGSEMDAEAASFASRQYGITVHHGSATEIPVPAGGFDVVFLSEVIEHVLDPVGLLRDCARLVAPGGWLCLSTPNGAVRHRAGPSWAQLRLDLDHLTAFNDASMRRALRDAGLVPVEVLTHGRPSLSSERWQTSGAAGRLPRVVARVDRVARRVLASVRTPHVPLDPQDGYTLLCSARRPREAAL